MSVPPDDTLARDVDRRGRLLGEVVREQKGESGSALTINGIAAGLQNTG